MTPEPQDIHEALIELESFDDCLEQLDQPGAVEELRAVVDAYGSSTLGVFEHELAELSLREVGLIRIAWEAHHQDTDTNKAETASS